MAKKKTKKQPDAWSADEAIRREREQEESVRKWRAKKSRAEKGLERRGSSYVRSNF